MANPNIVNVTTIYGNTAAQLATTTMTTIVSNPAGSGSIYKINNLVAANINTAAYSITAEFNNSGSNAAIAKTIVVPAYASLVIIAKDSGIYLTENTSLQVLATANSALQCIASWEQIS